MSNFAVGDLVILPGYHDAESLDYGLVHEITELREFQNASDDNYHLSALLQYEWLGETRESYYPVCFLKKIPARKGKKND